MSLRIAAIRTGTDPVRRLRIHSFPRVLEQPLLCPKCDASYSLTVDWDEANNRWFAEASRPLITLLKRAIHIGHGDGHRISHFETEGVVVEKLTQPAEPRPAGPTTIQ